MRIALQLILALCFVSSSACKDSGPAGPGDNPSILFIGNSYLYTKDIPAIVRAMALANGEQLSVADVTGPDMALVDHLETGAARSTIAKGGWTYVVLQQGPSSVSVNRDTLRLATAEFNARIKSVGARTALFSAWPSKPRRADFPRAIESYELAASDVKGIYIPVAKAWLIAWDLDPSLELYDDDLHPSDAGAYLAALVVYATLMQHSPRGLPSALAGVSVDAATANLLQEAAAQATGR